MTELIEHIVRKDDLKTTKWVSRPTPALEDGDVLLAVDKFALTANNVTYAVFGDAMGYWRFFPAAEDGWGRVPMWGFATVAESKAEGVAVGSRVYGYVPASNAFVAKSVSTSGITFRDNAESRQGLAPIYNTYTFTTDDPVYRGEYESEQLLYRPLFATGWWLADLVTRHPAQLAAALLTSASSKTALALAWSLNASDKDIETIGLTSTGNVAFTDGTGLYARVIDYKDVPTMQAPAPNAIVDMRGAHELRVAMHTALGETLAASIAVGATDWDAPRSGEPIPGPQPEMFFAPDYFVQRLKEDRSMINKMNADLVQFYTDSQAFITAQQDNGQDAIEAAWQRSVIGGVAPDTGLILTL